MRSITRVGAFRSISKSRFYSTIQLSQLQNAQPPKPQIKQFSNPLFHTFLIASSAYILLHSWWISLEYENKEKELIAESKRLEELVQDIINEKQAELINRESSRKWYKLWLWK
ncbi:uncharacterized protein RJT21DRAFT_52552 [Scheffersomyces amazonensis]|uniref:uncharacterized protein n=1 Tax=Scheffersomyces amazonensis TaxID=1078765 RepID=UPI00315CD1CF